MELSATVVFGLSFSTLLTLFLTPAALAAPMVLSQRFARLMAIFGVQVRRRPSRVQGRPVAGPAAPEPAE